MPDLNRRSFLTGVAAAAIAPALPLKQMVDTIWVGVDLVVGESCNGFGYVECDGGRECTAVCALSASRLLLRRQRPPRSAKRLRPVHPNLGLSLAYRKKLRSVDRGNERLDRVARQSSVPCEPADDGDVDDALLTSALQRHQAFDEALAAQLRRRRRSWRNTSRWLLTSARTSNWLRSCEKAASRFGLSNRRQ